MRVAYWYGTTQSCCLYSCVVCVVSCVLLICCVWVKSNRFPIENTPKCCVVMLYCLKALWDYPLCVLEHIQLLTTTNHWIFSGLINLGDPDQKWPPDEGAFGLYSRGESCSDLEPQRIEERRVREINIRKVVPGSTLYGFSLPSHPTPKEKKSLQV